MSDLLVVAESISRRFHDGSSEIEVLRDATFTIARGERIALVGPSGSGKTTLLGLVAGLDEPTAGVISWPAIGARDKLRPGAVTFAFQGDSLIPALTAAENVALPLILAGLSSATAHMKADDALGLFGLSAVGDSLPEELSGGQAQRVGLSRAVAGEPLLILADEPTGQLDRGSADRAVGTLIDVAAQRGAALVVATHDPAIAGRMHTRWDLGDRRLEVETT